MPSLIGSKVRPAGEVVICGLGIDPASDASLEALRELGRCDLVFCGLPGRRVRSWLRGLVGSARPWPRPEALIREARRGSRVGLAVWGHPRITSRLALAAESLCARRGVRCRIVAGISPLSDLLARRRAGLGWGRDDLGAVTARERSDVPTPPPSAASVRFEADRGLAEPAA